MELKHITTLCCPTCCSPVKAESLGSNHSNGTQQETRRFACNHELEYSPNFSEVRELYPCPNSQKEKMKRHTRAQLIEQLCAVLDKSKADSDFKTRLRLQIRSTY